ncbi:glycosyltransferase [Halosolutus amylolyticus]|uniref:Glycosyltransferase n=1 Tax=Halosolutus amylolyticus TaxID=2932267 RepID=A0ABD5PNX4_9EURY|nr:glycosyltransferase family A protein [Halosolutus amylolyticus]
MTPARNEADNLPAVVERVRAQEQRPACWLIVDDGSTDRTPELLETYTEEVPWISAVRLDRDASEYDSHYGPAKVISTGLEIIARDHEAEWAQCDYVGVLDCDILVRDDYFSSLQTELRSAERRGIVSGLLHERDRRDDAEGNPWGGAMLFDRQCLADIGGYPVVPSHDAVFRVKVEKRGWKTYKTPETCGLQLRSPHSARGLWNGYKREGESLYFLNYHPINALLAGVYHALRSPYYQGVAYLYGYTSSYARGREQISDPEVEEHYREERFDDLKRRIATRGRTATRAVTTRVRHLLGLNGVPSQ